MVLSREEEEEEEEEVGSWLGWRVGGGTRQNHAALGVGSVGAERRR